METRPSLTLECNRRARLRVCVGDAMLDVTQAMVAIGYAFTKSILSIRIGPPVCRRCILLLPGPECCSHGAVMLPPAPLVLAFLLLVTSRSPALSCLPDLPAQLGGRLAWNLLRPLGPRACWSCSRHFCSWRRPGPLHSTACRVCRLCPPDFGRRLVNTVPLTRLGHRLLVLAFLLLVASSETYCLPVCRLLPAQVMGTPATWGLADVSRSSPAETRATRYTSGPVRGMRYACRIIGPRFSGPSWWW
ncbi:hypothetical protein HPB50_011520 [Hyalomma asiaticum]|uniref:Uncharacterized protein n=1 Tax=Hyalomma asiaticum TaxID=266040 RepID=A0ACB7T7I0_HYAAI|nr:hypothetical protein HPB50_011520 [Hyalomma asiaticum]